MEYGGRYYRIGERSKRNCEQFRSEFLPDKWMDDDFYLLMLAGISKASQANPWEMHREHLTQADVHTMDKSVFKSYNHAIALSVVDYFKRHYRKEADPYLETRQREEYVCKANCRSNSLCRYVEAVELAMEKPLPLFLAGLFSGKGQYSYNLFLSQIPFFIGHINS